METIWLASTLAAKSDKLEVQGAPLWEPSREVLGALLWEAFRGIHPWDWEAFKEIHPWEAFRGAE